MNERLINVAPEVVQNTVRTHEQLLFIQMNFLTNIHWLVLMSIPFSFLYFNKQTSRREKKRRKEPMFILMVMVYLGILPFSHRVSTIV